MAVLGSGSGQLSCGVYLHRHTPHSTCHVQRQSLYLTAWREDSANERSLDYLEK